MSGPRRVGPRHRWRVRLLADVVRHELARHVGAPTFAGTESRPPAVLDAGCGDGSLGLELARSGRTVIGIDVDREKLSHAVQRARRRDVHEATGPADRRRSGGVVAFACADVGALPLRDGDFDVAAAGEVLEHIVDDASAVGELARVLVPDGALAVTVPAGPERFGPGDRRAGHVRRYGRSGLERVLDGSGLEVVSLEGWGFPFGRLYDRWVQRPALAASGGVLGSLIGAAGRSDVAWVTWSKLFALDGLVPAGHRGSGWLAVARRPKQRPLDVAD